MQVLRTFLKTAVWILAANLVVKVTWVLGIEVLMQNALGLELYGTYYTLLNLSFIFAFFIDFGFSRYSSTSTAIANTSDSSKHFSIVRWKLLLSVVYLIATILLGYLLAYPGEQILYLIIISLGQVLASYILYFRSVFTGLRRFFWEGTGSVLDRLIMTVLCLFLLWGPLSSFLSVTTYVLVQLTGYFVSFLILGAVWSTLHTNTPGETPATARFMLPALIPFTILVGLETIGDKTSIILVERLLTDGAAEAGKYAFGLRWLDAFKMFASLVGLMLLPFYAQLLGDGVRATSLATGVLKITFLSTVIGVIVLTMFSAEIMVLLTGQHATDIQVIFIINVLSFLPYPIIYVTQPLLTVQMKIKELNRIYLSGLIIILVGGVAIVFSYGATGVSAVFLFAMVTIAALQLRLARTMVSLGDLLTVIGKGLVLGILLAAVCYGLKMIMSSLAAAMACLVLAPGLVLALRMVTLADVRTMLSEIQATK